jgi:RimJ/RimL family protein N-acetyltransferase
LPRLIPAVLPEGTFRDHPQPRLTTGDAWILRPWQRGDAAALASAYDDPAIRYWHHRTMSPDEAADRVADAARRWVDETDGEWAVVDGHEVLGRVALRGVDLTIGQGEISYWTLPHARQRGVASAAVERLAAWALEEVGFWRLEIRHSTHNPGSCRVASRAGFVQEARLMSQHIHEDGWHDVHVHGRLRSSRDGRHADRT